MGMKPLMSMLVLLVLFQALVAGSLVKLDSQAGEASDIQKSMVQKSVALDPFLLPENAMVSKALTGKTECFPFNNSFRIIAVNYLPKPLIRQLPYAIWKRLIDTGIPVFILHSILRL